MLGIKVIKESEYNNLKEVAHRHYEAHKKEQAVYEQEKKDCESLRQQLNDKIKEVNKLREQNNNLQREVKSLREFRRDTLEAMGQIDLGGFQLLYCTTKCKNCKHKKTGCAKHKFGSHEYCIIPK